jgi:hypothetical protein
MNEAQALFPRELVETMSRVMDLAGFGPLSLDRKNILLCLTSDMSRSNPTVTLRNQYRWLVTSSADYYACRADHDWAGIFSSEQEAWDCVAEIRSEHGRLANRQYLVNYKVRCSPENVYVIRIDLATNIWEVLDEPDTT